MSRDNQVFSATIRLLSAEENAELEMIRGQFEVRLLKAAIWMENEGWIAVHREPTDLNPTLIISCDAQRRLAKVLLDMAVALHARTANALSHVVRAADFKWQLDEYTKNLLDYAVLRWNEFTRGLPLATEIPDHLMDPRGVFGGQPFTFRELLEECLRPKAREFELQNWQSEPRDPHSLASAVHRLRLRRRERERRFAEVRFARDLTRYRRRDADEALIPVLRRADPILESREPEATPRRKSEAKDHQLAGPQLSEEHELTSSQNGRKKKRGRPAIPAERKDAALKIKAAGGTNLQAAGALYSTRHPTPQQKKSVPSILKYYQKTKDA